MLLSDRPKPGSDYYLELIDNELLLYHLSRTTILYCNQTASLVWQLCDGQRTVQEITALLGVAYPQATGIIADEIIATLQQFLEHGAITLTEGE